MKRKIIRIDEEKCNGCGLCAEACHEGAIGMAGGKAKLLRDDYCDGLGDCLPVCPVDAIEGKDGYIHMIDEFECTKCGKCISACENDAIIQTNGRLPKLPTRLTKCGKFKKRH